jgi:large subunit ribosomal protein L9
MPMNVILLERVPKLGQMGDVVKVKPGYARNFLLPQKKALRATKDNITYFESQRKTLEAQNLERRQEAEAVGAKMSDLKVTLIRQASEALQLYGSVSSRDIADAAAAAGVKFERGQVELDKPIKTLGAHKIKVHLHPEVAVDITAVVARSPDEAEFLAKGGTLVAETERAQLEAAEAGRRAVRSQTRRRRGRRGSRHDRGSGVRKEVGRGRLRAHRRPSTHAIAPRWRAFSFAVIAPRYSGPQAHVEWAKSA